MEAFGWGEQGWVDDGGANHAVDLTHGFAHCVQESATGVFHQVPTVRDLGGMWKRLGDGLAVAAAPIPGNNSDGRVIGKPGSRCCGLPIWQQCHGSTAFQINNDRAVAMVAPPSEVVDADDRKRLTRHLSPAPDNPQQCIVANRQHQTLRKAGGGTPAKRQPQMVDDVLHPTGAPRAAAKNILSEAFREDLLAARDGITAEPRTVRCRLT